MKDARRRWSRAERLADVMQRYDLPRPSLGECVLQVTDAGYTEEHAATLMSDAYENAVLQQRAYHEPWIELTAQLVSAHKKETADA
jgi:hypothetical protein